MYTKCAIAIEFIQAHCCQRPTNEFEVYGQGCADDVIHGLVATPGLGGSEVAIRMEHAFTAVEEQENGTCYAHAASHAYVETCQRISGVTPPSMREAISTATYNENGGRAEKAIELLEQRYGFGVRASVCHKTTLLELIRTSVIVSFALQSDAEWHRFARGEFLQPLESDFQMDSDHVSFENHRHACVVEEIDYERSELGGRTCVRLKNSWGERSGQAGRVLVDLAALRNVHFTVVYFTESSLPSRYRLPSAPGHLTQAFQLHDVPRRKGFSRSVSDKLHRMTAHWADESAALFRTDLLCFQLQTPEDESHPFLAVNMEEALPRLIAPVAGPFGGNAKSSIFAWWGKRVALRTTHRTYVRAHPGGEGARVDLQVRSGPWEEFVIVRAANQRYGLRSTHGTFVRANSGGEGAVVDLQVDKDNWVAMPWEQFAIVSARGTRVGFRSSHGTFLRAHPGGEGACIDLQVPKKNWRAMPWEQFDIINIEIGWAYIY